MLPFLSVPILILFTERGPEQRNSQNCLEFSLPLIEVKVTDVVTASRSRLLTGGTYIWLCWRKKALPQTFFSFSTQYWILTILCLLWEGWGLDEEWPFNAFLLLVLSISNLDKWSSPNGSAQIIRNLTCEQNWEVRRMSYSPHQLHLPPWIVPS